MSTADYDMLQGFIGLMQGETDIDTLAATMRWAAKEDNTSLWHILNDVTSAAQGRVSATYRQIFRELQEELERD